MDKAQFTSDSPGELLAIDHRKGWAFVPDSLLRSWETDPRLWPLLVDAKEALGALNGIGQVLPDPQLLLRPLQNREALASSRIEGTFVTPEQLLLYELDPREPKHGDEQRADWLEVFNYNRAVQTGCEMLQTHPICNRVILAMHKDLMHGARGQRNRPGEFRNWQVQIGSNARFVPAPPSMVPDLMGDLEKYVNSESSLDPLLRCFLVHYQFEAIHPFRDGNGRVGRALLALMIYKWLGHSMPWLYLSAFYERYREEYIDRLFQVSARGAWFEWLEFCLRATVSQARDAVDRCHKFHQLKRQFHDRIAAPTPRTHSIIDGLFVNPVVSVTSMQVGLASRTTQRGPT